MLKKIISLTLPQIIGLISLLIIFVISDFYKNIYGGFGWILVIACLILLVVVEQKRNILVGKFPSRKRVRILLIIFFITICLAYGAHFGFGVNKSVALRCCWGIVTIISSYNYLTPFNRPSFSLALFGWFIIGDAISKLLLR